MSDYSIFLIFVLAIFVVASAMLLLNKILGPKPHNNSIKLEPFECGATAIDLVNSKAVPVKFYAFAIIFVLFDLETIFLYLWALGAQPITGDMIISLLMFLAILEIVLLYIIHNRFLEDLTA